MGHTILMNRNNLEEKIDMNKLVIKQLETLEAYLLEQEEELPKWFKKLRSGYEKGKVTESQIEARCWGILPAELYYSIPKSVLEDLSNE